MQFIAELAKSLGWPITAGWIAWLFRRDMTTLLRRIVKGSIGGASVEFDQNMKDIAAKAPELEVPAPKEEAIDDFPMLEDPVELPELPTTPVSLPKKLTRAEWAAARYHGARPLGVGPSGYIMAARTMSPKDPRGAIFCAWRAVEIAILDLAESQAVTLWDPPIATETDWRSIQKQVRFPPATGSIVYDLYRQRIVAAGDDGFRPNESALETYITLAERVVDALLSGRSVSASARG